MPDKKLTDVTDNNVGKITYSEVVKALGRLSCKTLNDCKLINSAIDLINCQNEEIKEYEKVVGKLGRKDGKVICVLKGKETEYIPTDIASVYRKLAISKAKVEAYKEFAKQLDAEIESSDKYIREYDDSEVQKAYNKGLRDALKVLKELVGE